MRDIVATIQPEQDVIVRADLSESVCVQGAPGTGKTAVGLHRAAYLLYAHRDQLTRQGVLVVGPNSSFLALHRRRAPGPRRDRRAADHHRGADREDDGRHQRALRRPRRGPGRRGHAQGRRPPRRGRSPCRVVAGHDPRRGPRRPARRPPLAGADVRGRGDRRRAPRPRRPVRRGPRHARAAAGPRDPARGWRTSGDAPTTACRTAVARSRPVKQYVDAVWPAGRPGPAGAPAAVRPGVPRRQRRRRCWTRRSSAAAVGEAGARRRTSARWCLADAVLIDEAADLVERTPSLGHVVADEAQDLSPMMLRAVGRRCTTGSVTVLGRPRAGHHAVGDAAPGRSRCDHLGKAGAHVEELTRGFRVPGEVIDYAARLLPGDRPRPRAADLGTTSPRRARADLDRRRRPVPRASRSWPALRTAVGLDRGDRARRARRRRRRGPAPSAASPYAVLGRDEPSRRRCTTSSGRSTWCRLARQGPRVRPRDAARAGGRHRR